MTSPPASSTTPSTTPSSSASTFSGPRGRRPQGQQQQQQQQNQQQHRPQGPSIYATPTPPSPSPSPSLRHLQEQTHPARRRLQFWIQQTWRGHGSSHLGFGTEDEAETRGGGDRSSSSSSSNSNRRGSGGAGAGAGGAGYGGPATGIGGAATPPSHDGRRHQQQAELQQQHQQQQQQERSSAFVGIGTAAKSADTGSGGRGRQPRRLHRAPVPVLPASLSLTTTTAAAAAPHTTASAAFATVANVDQALNALSTYNNERYFPSSGTRSGGDSCDSCDNNNNSNNNNNSSNRSSGKEKEQQQLLPAFDFDWILDGHPEWHDQHARTRDLLRRVADAVPGLSAIMTGEEEERFLWQMGCLGGVDCGDDNTGTALGQQEYQFAEFPPPHEVTDTDEAFGGVDDGRHRHPSHVGPSGTAQQVSSLQHRRQEHERQKQREGDTTSATTSPPETLDTTLPISHLPSPEAADGATQHQQQRQQQQQQQQHARSGVCDDDDARAGVAITSPSQTQDFERFWQAAVTAPTPEGTWSSLDSESTHRAPSPSDGGAIRSLQAETKSPASLAPPARPLRPPSAAVKHTEVEQPKKDVRVVEDEEFGDFQEATKATGASFSVDDQGRIHSEHQSRQKWQTPQSSVDDRTDVPLRRQDQPKQDASNAQEDNDSDGTGTARRAELIVQSDVDNNSINNSTNNRGNLADNEIVEDDNGYDGDGRDDEHGSSGSDSVCKSKDSALAHLRSIELGETAIQGPRPVVAMPTIESTHEQVAGTPKIPDKPNAAAFDTPSKKPGPKMPREGAIDRICVKKDRYDDWLGPGLPVSPSVLKMSPTSPFQQVAACDSHSLDAHVATSTATTTGLHTPRASPPSIDEERQDNSQLEPPTPITKNHASPDVGNVTTLRVYGTVTRSDSPRQDEAWSALNNGDENSDSNEDEDVTRAESLFTDASNKSSSIPSVVQLFTKSVQPQPSSVRSHSILVPQTVRMASTTFFASSSIYFGSNVQSMQRQPSLMIHPYGDLDDEPSLASSLASPEVKFFRRRNSQQLLQSPSCNASGSDENDETGLDDRETMSLGSLTTLPDQYWKYPELDHTLQELKKLEWDWLPYWRMGRLLDETDAAGQCIPTDTVPLLQDQITQRLSELDGLYGKVCKKVYRKIQPHAEELIVANQAALDLQRNLQLAQMYLNKSQKSIQLAKCGSAADATKGASSSIAANTADGSGIMGAIQLLGFWDTQASYVDLRGIVGVIADIVDLENEILQRIDKYDSSREDSIEECRLILQLVHRIRNQLHSRPANSLDCLRELSRRSDRLISMTFTCQLHSCLESEVSKCSVSFQASPFDNESYGRLVEAMLVVRAWSIPEKMVDPANSFEGAFCTSIHTALLLEVQKALGRALLDPTDSENDETNFEQELLALSTTLSNLDSTRLSIWTRNLAMIRFGLEVNQSNKLHLPAVFHRQCWILTNILHGMFRLIGWHCAKANECEAGTNDDDTTEPRNRIYVQLRSRRASVWNACIQSLEECLEEYLKTSGKKQLFQWIEDKYDDSCWLQDLLGLEDVAGLIDQFLSLGKEFLEGIPVEVVNDGSMIREKFHSILKRHVRTFHVEAMNTMGNALYREDWILVRLDDDTNTGSDASTADHMFKCTARRLAGQYCRQGTAHGRSKRNKFTSVSDGRQLSSFLVHGNPFDIDKPNATDADGDTVFLSLASSNWNDMKGVELLELMNSCIDASCNATTKCILDWLLPWTSRLLILIEKLPSMLEEASGIMTNIFDLYSTTVFRLCAGNSGNERILLGTDELNVKATPTQEHVTRVVQRASSPHFGFGRRSQSQQLPAKPAPTLSTHLDAELCSLVPTESVFLASVDDLILDAQRNLQGIAKLDLVDGWIADPVLDEDTVEDDFARETARVLEKRQAACWSYISLAVALHTATLRLDRNCAALTDYSDRFIRCLPILIRLSSRISCMRAIRGRTLVKEILSVGGGWEESKLHEHPNEYVDFLCDFMALVWYNLTTSSFVLPRAILKAVWGDLVGGGYMVLLDAFAKVPFCSTEGRALMSMDLASYASGTQFRSIAAKLEGYPQATIAFKDFKSYRSMAYVDTYIKLFYFPSTDAIEWIESNFRDYHHDHMIALALSTARDDKEAGEMVKRVTSCYSGTSGVSESI